ncbi:MAG: MBOAT family protein [Alistipes sp.]|nr:MBOAT family protein [Candidatus Alistipes equi]
MFLSLEFWIAFPVFLLIYGLLKSRTKAGMMLWVVAFSLLFLFRANGIMMLLLPIVTIESYFLSKWMRGLEANKRKAVLTLSIVLTLIPLAYFKYANFAIASLNDILRSNFALRDILLPAGLSFYSLQAVSYQIDVYRKKFQDDVTLLEYAFYQTFFPVLLCGPITRSTVFFPQIKELGKNLSDRVMWGGVYLFIIGMIKKGAFADYIAQYTTMLFDTPANYSGFENLCGALGYTFQIYLDFSGYSDMAIGIAMVPGIKLSDNFNYPYKSVNVSEFWKRWHIALSSWFKDYLYIPLGGNRRGTLRTYWNLLIVMLVSGLWHGASWMFVLWGGLHGLGLWISKIASPVMSKIGHLKPVHVARVVLCFVFVSFCWIFFRSADMNCCQMVIQKIVTDTDLSYFKPFVQVRWVWCSIVIFCAVCSVLPSRCNNRVEEMFLKTPLWGKTLIFCLALTLMYALNQGYVAPMIYAQF